MTQTASYPDATPGDQHEAAAVIVKQLAAVQDCKALLLERESALKTALRELLGEGKHQVAGLTVNITANRRFNPDHAAQVYPYETHPDMWSLTVDAKKVNELVGARYYNELMHIVGDPRVTLR